MYSSRWSRFLNDRVTLVRKSGQRFEDLPALVESGQIFKHDPKIPIGEGDQFERKLPSGIVEPSPRPRQAAGPQVVYNLIGPNARVNIRSSDSSTNVVSVESAVLFDNLREAIRKSSLDSAVERQLIQNVGAMQSAVGTKMFPERYGEFISAAADHMTLVAPFLPALTQLLL